MGRRRLSTEAARPLAGCRRSLLALAAAALLLVLLAGCGESSSSSSTSTQAASATTATTSTPTTATTPSTSATAPQGAQSTTGTSATQSTPQGSTHSASPTPTTSAQAKPSTPNGSAAAAPGAKPLLGALAKKRAAGRGKGLGGLLGAFGTISLSSSAFKAGGTLPATYATCSSSSSSPPMQWQGVPHSATQLLLLATNPGAGVKGAVTWAVAMPASVTELPAGSLPAGAVAGTNSSGKVGWSGLCTASGTPQHVTFLLYALRHPLPLSSGFSAARARAGIKGNTVGTGLTVASAES